MLTFLHSLAIFLSFLWEKKGVFSPRITPRFDCCCRSLELVNTYIQRCINTYKLTYKHTCMFTCTYAHMHTCIQTCIHGYVYTCKDTCMTRFTHTYTHTYTQTHILTYTFSNMHNLQDVMSIGSHVHI